MTQLLHIDASARPGVRGQVPSGSHTRALTQRFVARWQAADVATESQSRVQYRDVGHQAPAPITSNWIKSAFSPANQRTATMQAALRESDDLVAELRAADVLVLGVPMYNFGPPAGFKAWIDNVVRVGATFDFDPERTPPYIPLLAERPRSVVFLTARGATNMGPGGAFAHANHLDGAVREALSLLGLTDWHGIAIEGDEHGGLALQQSVTAAMQAVDDLVAALHARHQAALVD